MDRWTDFNDGQMDRQNFLKTQTATFFVFKTLNSISCVVAASSSKAYYY